MVDCIDDEGFRANVGIVLANESNQLFWARRVGRRGWQFPQGGIRPDEDPLNAMYRELHEEIGLSDDDVELIGETSDWLRYRLPRRYQRSNSTPLCVGQKQRWYLLRLTSPEERVRFDRSAKPEFDHYRWVDFWYPPERVIFFKRKVYRQALQELAPYLFPEGAPHKPANKRRGS